jgi:hypothetical protein
MSEVAITLVYRHQPGACAPIDAGNPVADNGKVDDDRYYLACLFWLLHKGDSMTPICRHLGRDLVPQHHSCDWDNEFPKKVDFGNQDRVDGGMRNQPHFFYADA